MVICPSKIWATLPCPEERAAKETAKYVAGVQPVPFVGGLVQVLVDLFDTPCQDEEQKRIVRKLIGEAFHEFYELDLSSLEDVLRRKYEFGHTSYNYMHPLYDL